MGSGDSVFESLFIIMSRRHIYREITNKGLGDLKRPGKRIKVSGDGHVHHHDSKDEPVDELQAREDLGDDKEEDDVEEIELSVDDLDTTAVEPIVAPVTEKPKKASKRKKKTTKSKKKNA